MKILCNYYYLELRVVYRFCITWKKSGIAQVARTLLPTYFDTSTLHFYIREAVKKNEGIHMRFVVNV